MQHQTKQHHLFRTAAVGMALAIGSAAFITAADAQSRSKSNRPRLVATNGDWGAYVASGRSKICYALSQPKRRLPARLKRDPGYIFVSTRPRERVRNEISIIMGFAVKPGSEPYATIGSEKFELVAKGDKLWIRNAARNRPMLTAMRKGAKMSVHVTSRRGNKTVDEYSLSGITQTLARVGKECR